jgi:hypothetical protein
MNPHSPREKLDLTIARDVIQKAKKVAREKGIPLSRIVENFFEFFINPSVYCFKCGERFSVEDAELCPKCEWLKCPKCGICRCDLEEHTAIAVHHMRKVYEDLLSGRVKK